MDCLRSALPDWVDTVTMVHNGPTDVNLMDHHDELSHHLYNSLPMLSIDRESLQYYPRTNGPKLEEDKSRLFRYFNRLGPIKSVSVT